MPPKRNNNNNEINNQNNNLAHLTEKEKEILRNNEMDRLEKLLANTVKDLKEIEEEEKEEELREAELRNQKKQQKQNNVPKTNNNLNINNNNNNNNLAHLTNKEKEILRNNEMDRLEKLLANTVKELKEIDEEEKREEEELKKQQEQNNKQNTDNEEKVVDEHAEWLRKRDEELQNLVQKTMRRAPNKEQEKAPAEKIDDAPRISVFINHLETFNNMYKCSIDADKFAASISDAWTLIKNDDKAKQAEGKKMLGDTFKSMLKQAFDMEKYASYNEYRLPAYTEIIKSANEVVRSSMFAFTDLYHDPKSAAFFDLTAFGGLNEEEMAKLTESDGIWSMDQKSDEAWEIQSGEAKNLADKWLKEDKPYETMINEMNSLVEAVQKNGNYDRKEAYLKLTAAEWLLVNNEKMMIEDPTDPLNPIPNWGNRYWKTLSQTREALGIDKHTSMRDLIQNNYIASAKAVNSAAYNKVQIKENILDPKERAICDSLNSQREKFAIQSAAVTITKPQNEKQIDEAITDETRTRLYIKSEDERLKMKNEPKVFQNFEIQKTEELTIDSKNNDNNLQI